MTMMRLPPSRIGGTRGSPIKTRSQQTVSHVTGNSNLEQDPETTPIGKENNSSTARSRTTPRKNAEKESVKINCAETNKDVSIGLKFM
jgi:hypothetical protein